MMAEFCSILICCSKGKVKNLKQITWLRSDDDTSKRKNFIGIKKLIGKASNYQFSYDHKMLDLYRSGYLENFFSILSSEISTKSNYNLSKKKIKDIFLLSLINSINRKKKLKKFKNIKKILVFLIPSKIKKYIRFLLRINGPSLKDVMTTKVKVNYLFNKKELQILNKHFLND
jgi:hypothetical protein